MFLARLEARGGHPRRGVTTSVVTMSDDDALARWWAGLTDAQHERARSLTAGDPMPGWMLTTLVSARHGVPAAWWPESEAGPTFTVPAEVAEYVAEKPET